MWARVWGGRHFHMCLTELRIGTIFTGNNLIIGIQNLHNLSFISGIYKDINLKYLFTEVLLKLMKKFNVLEIDLLTKVIHSILYENKCRLQNSMIPCLY